MPDLVEQMYCSQQIFIPPNLPSILKKYAKAAIRTQPGDLLAWSSAYFRALAEGIPPPAKDRIEYPPVETLSGLSPGFLKVLINQIGKRETVHKNILAERWKGVCLNPKALQDLLDVGMFEDDVSWLEFLAICVGTLEPSLTKTMIQLCELLTDEPEGGRAAVPVTIFLNLYKYLAKLDCGPVNRLEEYEKALKADSETQCQATNLNPTEEEREPQEANIDWDVAIEERKGDESALSAGEDPDEGIVVEAADIENNEDERNVGTEEQDEEANTNIQSPELLDAKSEETPEVNEESVEKIELVDVAQSPVVSNDAELNEAEVSTESGKGALSEDVNELEQVKENGETHEMLEEIKAEGNEISNEISGDFKELGPREEGDINELDNIEDSGVSTDGAVEEIQDKAEDEKESPEAGVDSVEVDGDVPADIGEAIDDVADATSAGRDDSNGGEDAESAAASELEKDTKELDVKDERLDDGNEQDDLVTKDSEKVAIGENENEEEETKSDEVEAGENEEYNVDVGPSENVDETKDEKFDSSSSDSPGEGGAENEVIEETSATDQTSEIQAAVDIGESASIDGAELAEDAQVEDGVPASESVPEEPVESENVETKDESGEESDLTKDAADPPQEQIVEDAPEVENRKLVDQEVDPSKTLDETDTQEESAGGDQDATTELNEVNGEELGKDENRSGGIDSDTDAVSEAIDDTKISTTEIEEPVAKYESGNEIDLIQEAIEESLDPKTAYIVNDDGTLSAPRSESVVDEDALKERDSDNSVITKDSDDGMMVWPDIKPSEKEDADPEPLMEKEVISEDGIEVFTDVDLQPNQEELKLLPDQQEEEQVEAEEENIFAPQIDSFTDLLEAESAPVEETNPEQLAAALEGSEMDMAESGMVVPSNAMAVDLGESGEEEGPVETAAAPSGEVKTDDPDQKKEKKPRRQQKDVEIESLVKKDSDMMLLPTPITSDVMLYIDGACDKTAVKIGPTQQLSHKMSMIDVQVSVPVDETIVEVVEQHHYPKWMHIPGIGPTVPDYIIEEAEKYFLKISELQEGMVMPRNIRHFHCPPLEMVPDCPEGLAEGI